MPVEGRGLSWKQTQEVTKTEGLVMSLTTPESVQKLQAATAVRLNLEQNQLVGILG
jgi:hypothetical protein